MTAFRRPRSKIFPAILLVAPPVGVLAPKGTVIILVVAVLLCILSARARSRIKLRYDSVRALPSVWVPLTIMAFGWLGVSAMRSGDGGGLVVVLQLLGLTLMTVILHTMITWYEGTNTLSRAGLFGLCLASLIMVAEAWSGMVLQGLVVNPPPGGWHLERLNPGATNLVLFACSAAGLVMVRWGWVPCLLVMAAAAALATGFESLSAIVAGWSATAILCLAIAWPNAARMMVRWGAIGVVILMPLASRALALIPPQILDHLPAATLHRILIWNFTVDRIAERPVVGWGMDSARRLGEGQFVAVRGTLHGALPLHPHNMALQVWLETGLPGVALLVVGILWVTHRRDTDMAVGAGREIEPAKLALVVASGVIGLTAYGAWQMHWLSSVIIAGLAITAALYSTQQATGSGRFTRHSTDARCQVDVGSSMQ